MLLSSFNFTLTPYDLALIFPSTGITRKTEISDLPPEIIYDTFRYLSAQDLARCGKVCHLWRNLAHANVHKERLLHALGRLFPDTLQDYLQKNLMNPNFSYQCFDTLYRQCKRSHLNVDRGLVKTPLVAQGEPPLGKYKPIAGYNTNLALYCPTADQISFWGASPTKPLLTKQAHTVEALEESICAIHFNGTASEVTHFSPLNDGKVMAAYTIPCETKARSVMISPENLVVRTTDEALAVFKLSDGKKVFETSGRIDAKAAIVRRDNLFFYCFDSKSICQYALRGNDILLVQQYPAETQPALTDFHRNWLILHYPDEDELRFYSIIDGKHLATLPNRWHYLDYPFAILGDEQQFSIYRLPGTTPIKTFKRHETGSTIEIKFFDQPERYAIESGEKKIYIWDGDFTKVVHTLDIGNRDEPHTIAVLDCRLYLHTDGKTRVYNLLMGKLEHTYDGELIADARNQTTYLQCSDGSVRRFLT